MNKKPVKVGLNNVVSGRQAVKRAQLPSVLVSERSKIEKKHGRYIKTQSDEELDIKPLRLRQKSFLPRVLDHNLSQRGSKGRLMEDMHYNRRSMDQMLSCLKQKENAKQIELKNHVRVLASKKKVLREQIVNMDRQVQKTGSILQLEASQEVTKSTWLRPESNEQNSQQNELQQRNMLTLRTISPIFKLPHRYKTKMVYIQRSLFFFGGLGCQRELSWAKFDLDTERWHLPERNKYGEISSEGGFSYSTPIYGHSMVVRGNLAYIYGGYNSDSRNQLNIFDMKTLKMTQGPCAPFRRRQHCAVMLGKRMVVHGGMSGNDVFSDVFYLDTQTNTWVQMGNLKFPSLYSHGLAASNQMKERRRRGEFQGLQSSEWGYMFGGLNQHHEAVNDLYRFRFKGRTEMDLEQIHSPYAPSPRYSMCFQFIDSFNLVVYGGREVEENENEIQTKGIYSDVKVFKINSEKWTIPELPYQLGPRHSMAATSINNKLFIYGGSDEKHYANSDITVLGLQMVWMNDKMEAFMKTQNGNSSMLKTTIRNQLNGCTDRPQKNSL